MSGGYSFTTISADRDGPMKVRVSFHLDDTAHVQAYAYDGGRRAHLAVELGDIAVSIGPADPDAVTAADARAARHFAEQAAEYAQAVERIAVAGKGGPAAA